MLRILCLDDDPIITEVMTGLLEELGHEVIGTASASDALDMLRHATAPFHLLMVDVHLANGIDGRGVAQLAHETHPGLPIIHFTGDTLVSADSDMIVLPKPCTMGMLEAAIAKALPGLAPPRTAETTSPATSSGETAWTIRWGAGERVADAPAAGRDVPARPRAARS